MVLPPHVALAICSPARTKYSVDPTPEVLDGIYAVWMRLCRNALDYASSSPAILAVLLEEFTRGRTKFQESHQGCASLHFLRIACICAELWLVAVFLLAPAFFIWKHRRRFDGGSLVRGNGFSARFRLARAGPRNPP